MEFLGVTGPNFPVTYPISMSKGKRIMVITYVTRRIDTMIRFGYQSILVVTLHGDTCNTWRRTGTSDDRSSIFRKGCSLNCWYCVFFCLSRAIFPVCTSSYQRGQVGILVTLFSLRACELCAKKRVL